ncbi:teichoic acid transporter [Latilactobacillus sakei]|uniref:O-antigen transporter n=1 Tax=Latilactobacillus sakei TaxID=1599 RepID=A0AAE8LVQ9_LATSK|nr:oligosaccharide flippase family protein [Latilactobacillus sakei]ARJ71759.1 teichoic acid transporter [Latilactobacillus sakei]USF96859.1 teichoic acid transporter [Latilactobacillus sakei]USS38390.1 oligosaccharide flippase family protein [Latilactobacillus sakei]SOB40010.1 Teichoic acid/polysaccharide export protein [Latilactobacillus sakei]SPE20371.1 Putative O-antigen transporter [Latilactobacillus sakei]
MKKASTNIIYNAVYQLLIIVLPFVTTPYVARVLGKEALGINSYVNSIPVFLSFIILMGMNQVGVRVIAQSTKENLEENFKKLWGLQLLSGLIVIISYIVVVCLFMSYKFYFLIEIPFLIGYVLDISWFYIGRGQVKTVVMRNTIIKLTLVATIFIFVHSEQDLWIYLLINSITYLANFVFWLGIKTEIPQFKFGRIHFSKQYLKESITVTIPSVAAQFYTSFDQTIIGLLAGSVQLTYYAQTQTMARAVVQLLGSVTIVLMPIMAKMDSEEADENQIQNLLKVSLDYTLILGLLFTSALMVNANKFIVWFFGSRYQAMTDNFFWVSLLVVIIPYGGIYANQFALSKGMYRIVAIPYLVGAVFSLIGNFVFAGRFGANGGTTIIVLTELLVCGMRIWLVRGHLDFKFLWHEHWKYWLIFSLTLLIGLHIPINLGSLFFDLVVQTIIVGLLFVILLVGLNTRVRQDLMRLKKG